MRDETSGGRDAGRLERAAGASEADDPRTEGDDPRSAGDDPRPLADGEDDSSLRAHEVGRQAELVDSAASHRRWMAIASACAVAAVVLLLTVGVNAAFVAAVLGVVAWFWDQRNRIRANIIEDEHSGEGRDELEEFEDEGDEDGRDGEGAGGRRSLED